MQNSKTLQKLLVFSSQLHRSSWLEAAFQVSMPGDIGLSPDAGSISNYCFTQKFITPTPADCFPSKVFWTIAKILLYHYYHYQDTEWGVLKIGKTFPLCLIIIHFSLSANTNLPHISTCAKKNRCVTFGVKRKLDSQSS